MSRFSLNRLHEFGRSLLGMRMSRLDYHKTYRKHVRWLMDHHPLDQAMSLAVGGEFTAMGILQRDLLVQCGLTPDDYLVDVGCGAGRLSKPLSEGHRGRYLGIDPVPELVRYARQLVPRRDWRFEIAEGLRIPVVDSQADMVCFFSVFTHLLHEESYVYLQEARRVLKPGGRVVFTFLEFAMPNHWSVFETNIADLATEKPINMFLSRDAIQAWAGHLHYRVEALHDGNLPHIRLSQPVRFDDGHVAEQEATMGQSTCVLSVEDETRPAAARA